MNAVTAPGPSGTPVPPAIEITEPRPPAAHTSQSWPIAAAMLQFSSFTRSGGATRDASSAEWASLLAPIVHEGFSAVELSNRWLDLATVSDARLAELRETCGALGLATPGYLVASRSLMDPLRREENLRYTHESIDAAATVGIGTVCLGLHSVRPREARGPLWFWTVPGSTLPEDPALHGYLIDAFRELGAHAQDRGIQVSLEMYPDTPVGTSERAVAFIEEVAHPSVGLNPDLGNLVRVQGPIEDWEDVAVRTLGVTNYWHVKNYSRAEDPASGIVLTQPSTLELGMIDYRKALRFAVGVGFAGTIVAEHYGGDGLGVSATNQRYLRRLLASILDE